MNNITIETDKNAFNVECPLCFESDGEMLLLSCFHRFHYKCLKMHTDLNCPQCRKNVLNWGEPLRTKIKKNMLKFKSELEEENRQTILHQESQNPYIFKPPPHVEVILAINYLKNQKIPIRYLCGKMNIYIQKKGVRISGQIFCTIINSVENMINKEIGTEELNDVELNDDDPFESENCLLESTMSSNIIFINID